MSTVAGSLRNGCCDSQFAQHFIVFWAKNDTERGWHFKEKKVPSILHLIYPSYLQIISHQLQPIPNIVLVAGLLAFLLNFPISYLEKRGVGRAWSVLLVLVLALTAFLILGFGVAPIVYQQLIEFSDRLPGLIDQGQRQLQGIHINIPLAGLSFDTENFITEVVNKFTQSLESLPSQIVDFLFGVFDSTLNFLITIVLTILLIFNGSILWNALFKLFPQPWNIQLPSALLHEGGLRKGRGMVSFSYHTKTKP